MSNKYKVVESARALLLGQQFGLGSMMDIPDDTRMQRCMYVHRARSEAPRTCHGHVAVGSVRFSVAFLGSRKKKAKKKERSGFEDFGGNYLAPRLVAEIIWSPPERSLGDECTGQDVHARRKPVKKGHAQKRAGARASPSEVHSPREGGRFAFSERPGRQATERCKGMDDGRGAGTRKKDSTRLGGRVGSWTDAPVHGPEAKSCKADRIYIYIYNKIEIYIYIIYIYIDIFYIYIYIYIYTHDLWAGDKVGKGEKRSSGSGRRSRLRLKMAYAKQKKKRRNDSQPVYNLRQGPTAACRCRRPWGKRKIGRWKKHKAKLALMIGILRSRPVQVLRYKVPRGGALPPDTLQRHERGAKSQIKYSQAPPWRAPCWPCCASASLHARVPWHRRVGVLHDVKTDGTDGLRLQRWRAYSSPAPLPRRYHRDGAVPARPRPGQFKLFWR